MAQQHTAGVWGLRFQGDWGIIRHVLPKVAILCGGRGTRLQAHSPSLPKPLVEIGGRPILWHVIQIYLAQGSATSCSSAAMKPG
jgi:molybdopterin-guanine dinucleotide biosynthesis protein A